MEFRGDRVPEHLVLWRMQMLTTEEKMNKGNKDVGILA